MPLQLCGPAALRSSNVPLRYLLGPRAAEAIFEGWLPDSIKRSEKEWDALISVYRSKNAKSDEELAAARAADAAKPKRPRSVSPGSARTARPTTPIVPAAAAQARPVSPSLHATRNRGAPAPSAAGYPASVRQHAPAPDGRRAAPA